MLSYCSAYGDATRQNPGPTVVQRGASTSRTRHPAHTTITTQILCGRSDASAGSRVRAAVDHARRVAVLTLVGRLGSRYWTARQWPWRSCVRRPRYAQLRPTRTPPETAARCRHPTSFSQFNVSALITLYIIEAGHFC